MNDEATTDNLADKQRDERSGQAGTAQAPQNQTQPSSTDAPVVPDDEHPQIPAGSVPPDGQPESPQDIIREDPDRANTGQTSP